MVGKAILHSRFVRAALAAILGSCLVLAGGCVSAEYAAISLKPGAAAADLQDLARRAQGGDKRAQYELGLRYEVGDGIPRSPSRARILYTAAAADSGGTRMMLVPQRNGAVSTVPVNSGALVPGLPEARAALAGLEADTRNTAPYQEPKTRSQSVAPKQAHGTLEFIDVSSLCEQHLEAIQRLSDWHIAECYSRQYRLTRKNGQSLVLVDLFLVTDDSDAIEDVPIPFGLLDPFINSPSLDDDLARVPGAVSYLELVTDSGIYNIISSFSEGEK